MSSTANFETMSHPVLFKWKHFQPEIILLNARWVLQYGPELDQRCRRHLRPTNDSWKVDETYTFATM
jgi:hypothetical protein